MFLTSEYLLSILVSLLIVLIVIKVKRKLEYFSNLGIPYSKPTLKTILKSFSAKNIVNYPFEIYNKEKGSGNSVVGYFDAFLKPRLLVVHPSMVQNVCVKDFSHFQDHGFDLDISYDPMAGNLFNMNGDEWRALRIKMLPTFTSGKLKGMMPGMVNCAQSVIKQMNLDSHLRHDANMKTVFNKYTIATIASCVFGIDPESIKDVNCEYQRMVRKVLTPSFLTQIKFFCLFIFPKVTKFLRLKTTPQDVEDFFMKLTKDSIETRKRSGVKRNDFVQLLVELQEKGSIQFENKDLEEDEKRLQQQIFDSGSMNELEITHEILAAQVFAFIIAGFDNSSYLVAITVYLLSKSKDIQQRVREEVRAAKSKHGGINYESLKDMKLLDASMCESMRMYPALFFLFRVCTKDYQLSNGSTVEKGTSVIIPTKSFQNDSRFWRNPEEFIPERFITDEVHPGTFLPFGEGPRLCMAQRMAHIMTKTMLAVVIDNFELMHSKKNKEPLISEVLTAAEVVGGLWATFKPLRPTSVTS